MRITSSGLVAALLALAACSASNERGGGPAGAGDGGGAGADASAGTGGDASAGAGGDASATAGDAGVTDAVGEAEAGGGALQGRHSFDLVATLTVRPEDQGSPAASQAPAKSAFTVVLDPEAHQAIVGGGGRASIADATSADGKTFVVTSFETGVVTNDPCMPVRQVNFGRLEITISGSTVRGTAEGTVTGTNQDTYVYPRFTAEVTGAADTTPPFLFESSTFKPTSFGRVALVSNEPLPATAKAWLTTAAGAHIDLVPTKDPENSLVVGFAGPDSVLPPADRFTVVLDGLVDFAGQRGTQAAALQLPGFPTPPLVPEDGFESATGQQLGGAAIVTSVGALEPLAGSKSLYFGASGVPVPPGSSFTAGLTVRLAAKPGATKLRFSYGTVSTASGGYGTAVLVGSVGHAAKASGSISASGVGTKLQWANGVIVTLGAVTTMDLALPAEVTDEVVVAFDTFSAGNCGIGFGVPPRSGVLVDDLRLE